MSQYLQCQLLNVRLLRYLWIVKNHLDVGIRIQTWWTSSDKAFRKKNRTKYQRKHFREWRMEKRCISNSLAEQAGGRSLEEDLSRSMRGLATPNPDKLYRVGWSCACGYTIFANKQGHFDDAYTERSGILIGYTLFFGLAVRKWFSITQYSPLRGSIPDTKTTKLI